MPKKKTGARKKAEKQRARQKEIRAKGTALHAFAIPDWNAVTPHVAEI
jgi:hypothetical protein